MKLDYATLISPYPFHVTNVGHIKPPTLRAIWNPDITYRTYAMYLYFLSMDARTYYEKINPDQLEEYNALPFDTRNQLTMFDVIIEDKTMCEQYRRLLEFFFVEKVAWNEQAKVYVTYSNVDENNQVIPTGMIYKSIWEEVCDVILQICSSSKKSEGEERPRFKNATAEKIWLKTQEAKKVQKVEENKCMELPNIVSAVSARSETLNIINIWDLTVYQLYDQFNRIQRNVLFDISATSVAAHGDKDGKFDSGKWYEVIYEETD